MKIAFASCMSTQVSPNQLVWSHILGSKPDHLVLTGDSIYIDAIPNEMHPKELSDDMFVQHTFKLWRALLAESNFSALVTAVPAYAVWDDHDFLWNESYEEKAIKKIVYKGMVRGSKALFNAFCRAIETQDPASFPSKYNETVLWNANEPAPGYRWRDLGKGIVLHLPDGRSNRIGKALLGQEQRTQMAANISIQPVETVHLVASGSVVEDHKSDCWAQFEDYAWLRELGRNHKILVLSGDVHRNDFAAIDLGAAKYLFDATSSGAAIRTLVTIGSAHQNYGLLDIGDTDISISHYSFGKPDASTPIRRIDRNAWTPLS